MSPSTSANDSTYNAHFGPHNIPFGIASITSTEASTLPPQVVTRISGHVIFLSALAQANYFTTPLSSSLPNIFAQATLNALAALPRSTIRSIRSTLTTLFTQTESLSETLAQLPPNSHFPIATVRMHLPLQIGDFTDFSVSRTHALRAGEAIMGKSFLPPAFHHFPLGYGGRSSSIVVSGTEIERPVGQMWNAEKDVVFGPSRAVDYELEVAAVVGKPVGMGKRVSMKDADEHIFGLVLLNDWSARDIQALEMTPLGPINGKNFGTSISPWVITLDALETFQVEGLKHPQPVASYLSGPAESYSIDLTAEIISHGISTVTCRSNLGKSLHWNFRHMLVHQTIGGCSLATGDLLASGTVSGESEDARGCLLESTWNGKKPIVLTDGSSRAYLEDGDTVRLTGLLGEGVGFGDCIGALKPARAWV